jgi:hypothetical protein
MSQHNIRDKSYLVENCLRPVLPHLQDGMWYAVYHITYNYVTQGLFFLNSPILLL